MKHYDAHGDSEWACGGDGVCDSVQDTPDCVDGLRHLWTSAGCGGCRSNPGVWSLGGTAYQYERRCRVCGVSETEIHHGSQRNPGECDTRTYEAYAYEPEPDAVRHAQRLARRRLLRWRARRAAAMVDVEGVV